MAPAAANPNADPILSEALGRDAEHDRRPGASSLIDQNGRPVSLASLRGHVVALTFLDPVCTSACPLIAQEFRQTDENLDAQGRNVDLVAVVAILIDRLPAYTNAFDRQEGLTGLSNWYFLTGSVPKLSAAWSSYGVAVETVADGAMVAHSDLAVVIDPKAANADVLVDDPGPHTELRLVVLLAPLRPDTASPRSVRRTVRRGRSERPTAALLAAVGGGCLSLRRRSLWHPRLHSGFRRGAGGRDGGSAPLRSAVSTADGPGVVAHGRAE